jgi:hypothetical protein
VRVEALMLSRPHGRATKPVNKSDAKKTTAKHKAAARSTTTDA